MKTIYAISLLILLNNLNAFSQPNAEFTTNRTNICSGTSVNFFNSSTGANAYEWFIEGMHYSFSFDTSAILYEGCYDLKEIKLVARDTLSGLSDTVTKTVEVFDTCFFHWTGTFLNCPGDTITLGINSEEIATHFIIPVPVNVIAGCLTCPSITFSFMYPGQMMADRISTYAGGCTETTTYEYFCTVSDINEINKKVLDIFPNPVSDILTLSTNLELPAELKILDYSGRVLHIQKIYNESTLVDLSYFSLGAYVIQTTSNDGLLVNRKLIKSK